MAGTGPAPTPNARRRNARPAFRRLPSAGRQGETPAWPLGGRASKAELALWAQLWTSPQAVAWEELGWVRTVARYARITIAAERPRAIAAVMSESRQLEDRLGLNPKAMRSLGWEISAVESVPDAANADDVADLDAFRARLGG
jgi:hypothetical protein